MNGAKVYSVLHGIAEKHGFDAKSFEVASLLVDAATALESEPETVAPASPSKPSFDFPLSVFDVKGSSVIDAFQYLEAYEWLIIRFKSGNSYRYEQVPVEIAREFRDAWSMGQYYNAYIKGIFKQTVPTRVTLEK